MAGGAWAGTRLLVVGSALAAIVGLWPASADAGVPVLSAGSGEARVAGRLGGYLTRPSDAGPARVALGYVRANASSFGIEPADLATLEIADRYTTPDGIAHLRWVQRAGGIPLYGDDLRANVAADGRLVNVIGSPRGDFEVPSLEPKLGPRAALGAALRGAGSGRAVPRIADPPSGPAMETEFKGPSDPKGFDSAELTLFGSGEDVRLAWRTIADAGPAGVYQTVVDARSGEILQRTNLTVEANDARVWDFYPGAAAGGTARTVDLAPWLTAPATTNELVGPFAVVWADFNDDNARLPFIGPPGCGSGENICPSNDSAPFQWVWPYDPFSYPEGNCPSAGCSWKADTASSWAQNMDQTGTQAFYFVNNFHDHLASDPGIAFNSASNNFEGDDDSVFVNVVDGANTVLGTPDPTHLNNANMSTLPEGQGALMQMYLWAPTEGTPQFRAVSGADDASIVYHEYAHGLSARLIVDSAGAAALSGAQPGAMGEGWSDWYAMDYLVAKGFASDTEAPGEVRVGDFEVTNNAFRTQALDCPVGSSCPGTPTAGAGGYTYGDFGKLRGMAEVHDDGEIWAETLWDLRAAAGSATARNLITGGMRLSPPNPSFLNMRDAILQQAQASGGDDVFYRAWAVFAARGMGQNASTTGPDDTAPVEDFTAPQPPDVTPPDLKLRGRKTQQADAAVEVRARCNEACTVGAGGTLTVTVAGNSRRDRRVIRKKTRTFRTMRARSDLDPDQAETLRLRLPRKARRLAQRSGATVRVSVSATDAAGNRTRKKRRVTLEPKRG